MICPIFFAPNLLEIDTYFTLKIRQSLKVEKCSSYSKQFPHQIVNLLHHHSYAKQGCGSSPFLTGSGSRSCISDFEKLTRLRIPHKCGCEISNSNIFRFFLPEKLKNIPEHL